MITYHNGKNGNTNIDINKHNMNTNILAVITIVMILVTRNHVTNQYVHT